MMDHNTLGDIFQEIIVELSEMEPTNLDTLEKKIREVLRRLGECMIQWKLGNWDTELHKEICSECDSKLENRKRGSQIATVVADVSYKRYRRATRDTGVVVPIVGMWNTHWM